MAVLNRLGFSMSYNFTERTRLRLASQSEKKEVASKILSFLLSKFAWDNLDVRCAPNIVRLVGKAYDFHGTILVGLQEKFCAPIVTTERFCPIDRDRIPTADVLLRDF